MPRTTDEIMTEFVDLAGALSPETLYHDGEATPEQVKASLKSIKEGWKKLEEEIGYTVTVDEAWDWYRIQKEIPNEYKITDEEVSEWISIQKNALGSKENNSPEQDKKRNTFSLKRK